MTVKQLREALEKYPDNMDVFMSERKTEFRYGLVNSVSSDKIKFTEDPFDDDDEAPEVECVILDEE